MTSTPSTPAALPVPSPGTSTRDEHGRLVAASWGGAPEDSSGHAGTWLVAVDGSEGALRAAAMSAQLVAAEALAGVDFFA